MRNILHPRSLLLTALCALSAFSVLASNGVSDDDHPRKRSRATRLDARGDQAFITSRYEKAMKFYERASARVAGRDTLEWLRMEIKMARIYNMLQDPQQTVHHYNQIFQWQDSLLNVDDACTYIDALRCLGRNQDAEIVARHFAFRSSYSRNKRFLNTLGALSNQHHYYAKGESDFAVELFESCGPMSEYWVGEWDGKLICAASHSQMLDPRKVFFHRTEYFTLEEDGSLQPFTEIPREIQDGSASMVGNLRVFTGISYRGPDRIKQIEAKELFRTQLYFTVYSDRRRGWSSPEPLFEHQVQANYAHPMLLEDGKTLLFSSDCDGGYGGMDLYIAHWNEETGQWGGPINLGATINSEGDEIFPFLVGNELFFASNGLEGFGGYDIYRVNFASGQVFPGSIYHYPYPVNSVWNDYALFKHGDQGYFISDRRGVGFRDDIYTFTLNETSISGLEALGQSQEYLALQGNLAQVKKFERTESRSEENIPVETSVFAMPSEGDVLLTLYFDFDRWELSEEARGKLKSLATDPGVAKLSEVTVVGYADEIGSAFYNQRLSEQRASQVSKFLKQNGLKPRVVWEGRGRVAPDPQDYRRLLSERWSDYAVEWNPESPAIELPLRDRIELNRTARRVDIIVKKK